MNTPRIAIGLLALAAFTSQAHAEESAAYAKPELLVGADELIDHHTQGGETTLSEAGVIYLDVRPKPPVDPNAANELPGSRWINAAEWKVAFGNGDDAAGWTKRIRAVVPDAAATVVVYDDGVTPTAGRIWWVLKYWGVPDVRLLNASVAERRDTARSLHVSSLPRRVSEGVPFVAKPSPARLVSTEQVRQISRDGSRRLIDSRKPEEFAAGIIPTAVHMDWRTLVDPQTGKLLPAGDLQKILAAAEVDLNKPTVTYCKSGGRASVNALMLELMGGKNVANYYGSWQAWTKQPAASIAPPAGPAK